MHVSPSVRVNLTIPGPVHEVMKRGAHLSGLSVSGFIASWLVFDLPALRVWLRQYHGVRAGELSFEGDPVRAAPGVGGLPMSVAEREDAVVAQVLQVRESQRLLQRQQGQRDAEERGKLSRAERRRAEREQRKSGGA